MKESTAKIGDGRKKEEGHDKTVSECFPCLWPEINYCFTLYCHHDLSVETIVLYIQCDHYVDQEV